MGALRVHALAALRQLLVGAPLPAGRARAAVRGLVPQLAVAERAARFEAAMALDALCERSASVAVDVCEAGGTGRLADAMAEVYHHQSTEDVARAQRRSPTAAYDLLREADCGNMWHFDDEPLGAR